MRFASTPQPATNGESADLAVPSKTAEIAVPPKTAEIAAPSKTARIEGARKDLQDQLLPFQIALQIIEHRLDSIALETLESNLQQCERLELSNVVQREASCDALLVQLEENLGMSKHNVRFSLQSILSKMEMRLKTMQQVCIVEPLMRRCETQLQAYQESATELLMASIERKLDSSETLNRVQADVSCLLGKYETHLQVYENGSSRCHLPGQSAAQL